MVHRFFASFTLKDILKLLGITNQSEVVDAEKFEQSYNVRAFQHLPIITGSGIDSIEIKIGQLSWQNTKNNQLLINSRIEDVKMKFYNVIKDKSNRVIVIVDGYYEWKDKNAAYAIRRKDRKQLFLGALRFDSNFAVFTQEARGSIGKIHERMPLFIRQDDIKKFLFEEEFEPSWKSIAAYNEDFIKEELDVFRVGEHVNNQNEKSDKCLQTYEAFMEKRDSVGIKRFFSVKSNKPDKLITTANDTKKLPDKSTKEGRVDVDSDLNEAQEQIIKKLKPNDEQKNE